MELPSIGRAEGTCGGYLGTRDREAGPPVLRYLDPFRYLSLTLGCVYTMSRHSTTKPHAKQQAEIVAKEDLVDLRHRRTQRRLRGARGCFSPSVSPLTWRTSALRIAL